MKNKVYLYDTTLRDGSQSEGISYSVEDKIRICRGLDRFGIDFIEGGWPYSNPKDTELFGYFKKHKLRKSRLAAFGSTMYPNTSANKDKNLLSLLKAGTEYVTIFGKSWDLHVTEVLRIDEKENLAMIADSVRACRDAGREVIYDAEHFFDGYTANPEYALRTLMAAQEAGADCIVAPCPLCHLNLDAYQPEIESAFEREMSLPILHYPQLLALALGATAVGIPAKVTPPHDAEVASED